MTSDAAIATNWNDLSIEELEEAVQYHNRKYWVDHAPEITDPEFDRLVEALRDKAPESAVLDAIGPAGADRQSLDEDAEKVTHNPPMLSLNKCYDEETLEKWFDKFEGDAIATPKVDGVAACLRYDTDGNLSIAATRGTGEVGEVMTAQARHIVNLPGQISDGDLEVRGEAVMPVAVFEEHFKHEYASPRNLTAGALKLKDPTQTAKYGIRFFAFDLLGPQFDTEAEKMARLTELGFAIPEIHEVSRDQLQSTYDGISSRRASLKYETDGVVYKANQINEQQRLGTTAHHPRFALAYKFQGESGESILREVQWSVSRTGSINPVGIVDPVNLSGASVTRVSLHNLAIMEGLGGEQGLTLGARVLMMRRGGVIPNLEKVIEHGDVPVEIPTECPGCGAPTRRENDILLADHRDDCRHARLKQLEHFVSVMEIKGFGPKLLEQLYEAGLVTSLPDFYTLTIEEMTDLDRVGKRLAKRQVERIDAARVVRADRFLRSLGIHELGNHVSAILLRQYPSLDAIRSLQAEELANIHTIGEIIAESVTQGLEENSDLIDELLQYITLQFPEEEEVLETDSPLSGKAVLFTGTMESMSRKEGKEEVKKRGGRCPSSVVRDLDYLVIGDGDMEKFNTGWRTNKLKKAERYNDDGSSIEIIGESTFLTLLQEE